MNTRRIKAFVLSLVCAFTMMAPVNVAVTVPTEVQAAAKPKLSIASTVALEKGKTLKATLKNATASKVTWKSSNKKVATVTKGKIKAVKYGKATITATYNKKNYKSTVVVFQDEIDKIPQYDLGVEEGDEIGVGEAVLGTTWEMCVFKMKENPYKKGSSLYVTLDQLKKVYGVDLAASSNYVINIYEDGTAELLSNGAALYSGELGIMYMGKNTYQVYMGEKLVGAIADGASMFIDTGDGYIYFDLVQDEK